MRCGATRAPPQQVGASRHRETPGTPPICGVVCTVCGGPITHPHLTLTLALVVLKNPIEVPVAPVYRLALDASPCCITAAGLLGSKPLVCRANAAEGSRQTGRVPLEDSVAPLVGPPVRLEECLRAACSSVGFAAGSFVRPKWGDGGRGDTRSPPWGMPSLPPHPSPPWTRSFAGVDLAGAWGPHGPRLGGLGAAMCPSPISVARSNLIGTVAAWRNPTV